MAATLKTDSAQLGPAGTVVFIHHRSGEFLWVSASEGSERGCYVWASDIEKEAT